MFQNESHVATCNATRCCSCLVMALFDLNNDPRDPIGANSKTKTLGRSATPTMDTILGWSNCCNIATFKMRIKKFVEQINESIFIQQ